MSEKRRKFDQDFKDGAVRIVLESGRPVAEVARELDVHEGTLANWVHKARESQKPGALGESERDELVRLRKEIVELRMQRDVLKRSVVLWVNEATGRRP
jgi:transposase